MMQPFQDPDVQVVTGDTYIGPFDTLLDRAVALFWRFPLRSELAFDRVRQGAARVGAGPAEVPVLAAAAVGYELLVRAGYLVTRLAPDAIPRTFGYWEGPEGSPVANIFSRHPGRSW